MNVVELPHFLTRYLRYEFEDIVAVLRATRPDIGVVEESQLTQAITILAQRRLPHEKVRFWMAGDKVCFTQKGDGVDPNVTA